MGTLIFLSVDTVLAYTYCKQLFDLVRNKTHSFLNECIRYWNKYEQLRRKIPSNWSWKLLFT